jgi:hypothetical protein
MLSKSTIGVPQISPRASVDWQGGHHPPERRSDDEHHHETPPEEPPHAPPPPGLGERVDKTV